ncbi:hypothetical protein [Citricoccus sp. K5]|uniref:hypothetical protein n=1 Tax=Citricoccus sp. K5 TaxID=2653135 RepID=UPI00135A9A5C|nr:hypothetical protein [Citricoccus sp. K5]
MTTSTDGLHLLLDILFAGTGLGPRTVECYPRVREDPESSLRMTLIGHGTGPSVDSLRQ